MKRKLNKFYALHESLMNEIDKKIDLIDEAYEANLSEEGMSDELIIRRVENDSAIAEIIQELKTL